MEAIIISLLPIAALFTLAVLLISSTNKEDALRMKLKFIHDLIEKGYEVDKIDLDALLNNKKIIEIKDKR